MARKTAKRITRKTSRKPASLAEIRAKLKCRAVLVVDVDGLLIELRAPKWRQVNEALRPVFKDGGDNAEMNLDTLIDFHCAALRLCLSGDHAKLSDGEIENLIQASKGPRGELMNAVFDLCGLRMEAAEDPSPFGSPAPRAAA